jgi:hypothetical protein
VGDDETDENGDDDGSENKEEKANGKNNDNSNNNANKSYQNHDHKIANLSCEAYGGPSDKDAEEMVYWEDIPEDALHMSPFHAEHPNNKKDDVQPITQYLTFDSDHGGWNNIRMAMGTLLRNHQKFSRPTRLGDCLTTIFFSLFDWLFRKRFDVVALND